MDFDKLMQEEREKEQSKVARESQIVKATVINNKLPFNAMPLAKKMLSGELEARLYTYYVLGYSIIPKCFFDERITNYRKTGSYTASYDSRSDKVSITPNAVYDKSRGFTLYAAGEMDCSKLKDERTFNQIQKELLDSLKQYEDYRSKHYNDKAKQEEAKIALGNKINSFIPQLKECGVNPTKTFDQVKSDILESLQGAIREQHKKEFLIFFAAIGLPAILLVATFGSILSNCF